MWFINPEVLVTDLHNEMVLLHPEKSEMFSLNATARELWQRLPATQQELEATLASLYGLSTAQATEDVSQVMQDLLARDLVRRG